MKDKILFLLISLFSLALFSCSETDGEADEYENWKSRNDAYFTHLYHAAEDSIAAGSKNWKIIRSLTKQDEVTGEKNIFDYIVVKVVAEGAGSESPLYTDSVRVHYEGRLMPTDVHPNGRVFDSSWSGPYNMQTMIPTTMSPSTVVNGFSTALQYMHLKDRWLVYIPYALGYGAAEKTNIPAYSTMLFDITLHSYSRPGIPMPPFQ